MKQKALRDALQSMAAMPGLEGCALVEIEAGMVWHHAGQIEGVQTFAEAASDYWRLYNRLADQFKDLGDLKASVMMHAQGSSVMRPRACIIPEAFRPPRSLNCSARRLYRRP